MRLPGADVDVLDGLAPLLVPIGSVKPDPSNPRIRRNLDKLVASIRRFGLRKPIVANANDKVIEAGHQTFAALIELGATEVPVLWANDSRVEAAAYNIADNRTAEIVADWDEQALADLLVELSEVDGGVEATGYTQAQIDGLIASFADVVIPEVEELPPTQFDGQGARIAAANRIIVVYDNDAQRLALEEALGIEIDRITYHVKQLWKK
jgi:ParB-like chromosome segregation protein Spo0J